MTKNFNTYIEQIDFEAWRDLCVSMGTLRHFAKGEEFVSIGNVGRYVGFIQSGTLKYVARSADGTEHVMGLVFSEGFVVDWRNFLRGKKANVAIIATADCDIYCITSNELKVMMDSDSYIKDFLYQRYGNAHYRSCLWHYIR